MAWEIEIVEASGVSCIDIGESSLSYLMATGQTVNSFYYDSSANTVRWNYCGTSYQLSDISYDYVKVARDQSGFCGYNDCSDEVAFYNAKGELILNYHVNDDIDLPLSLGSKMILYIFTSEYEMWWIYCGKRYSLKCDQCAEKFDIGFHSNLYIKEISRLKESVYNAVGERIYLMEKYPQSLDIGGVSIPIKTKGAVPLLLERYDLIAVCEYEDDFYFTSITLYDYSGSLYATVPLPEGTVAFHSIKLLEHTDIPVIVIYESLPDISRYFNNGVVTSVKPNMPMKLRWYELLPNDDGILAMYRSGELYQGFRDIDTITLEERHIRWR